jgi:hypothetical protein
MRAPSALGPENTKGAMGEATAQSEFFHRQFTLGVGDWELASSFVANKKGAMAEATAP